MASSSRADPGPSRADAARLSVLELFLVGIGPSSSHTVGPMRAAGRFLAELCAEGTIDRVTRVRVELLGSLGATGAGHRTPEAVMLGLEGADPETIDPGACRTRPERIRAERRLSLGGGHPIGFDPATDIVLTPGRRVPAHPNAMVLSARSADGRTALTRTYYSVGGGVVVDDAELDTPRTDDRPAPRHPFSCGTDLVERCVRARLRVSDLVLANEARLRTPAEVRTRLLDIWSVMDDCIRAGCGSTDALLPGALRVPRHAPQLHRELVADDPTDDQLRVMDWINLFAMAVNEENASGGRIVTAPTNGAAGVVPAVLAYWTRFVAPARGLSAGQVDDGIVRFLLAAGAVGALCRTRASISGAEVGCQGEIGSACAMAAAGLTEVCGGTPAQVENAAEIGIEHNLGLTCDPVGGLVQIPCIERNAIAAVKAVDASRLALRGDGSHRVSLDDALDTMRRTGLDMSAKYKETSLGGLAVTVVEC